MEGIKHFAIIAMMCAGLFIGGVLPDLDHTGTLGDKWHDFWSFGAGTEKGLLHKPMVMLCSGLFFISLGLGLIIHYMMDR